MRRNWLLDSREPKSQNLNESFVELPNETKEAMEREPCEWCSRVEAAPQGIHCRRVMQGKMMIFCDEIKQMCRERSKVLFNIASQTAAKSPSGAKFRDYHRQKTSWHFSITWNAAAALLCVFLLRFDFGYSEVAIFFLLCVCKFWYWLVFKTNLESTCTCVYMEY